MPQLLGDQVTEAFHGLLDVSPAWLWLAAPRSRRRSRRRPRMALGAQPRAAATRRRPMRAPATASGRSSTPSRLRSPAAPSASRSSRGSCTERAALDDRRRLRVHRRGALDLARARSSGFAAASGVLPLWPLGVLALTVAVAWRSPASRGSHPNAVSHTFSMPSGRSVARPRAPRSSWRGSASRPQRASAPRLPSQRHFGVERPLAGGAAGRARARPRGRSCRSPPGTSASPVRQWRSRCTPQCRADTAISAGIAFSAVETVSRLAFGAAAPLPVGRRATGGECAGPLPRLGVSSCARRARSARSSSRSRRIDR